MREPRDDLETLIETREFGVRETGNQRYLSTGGRVGRASVSCHVCAARRGVARVRRGVRLYIGGGGL